MFTNSRYADLRTAGAHFLDLVWQAHFGGGAELALIGPLFTAYADLAGACANHGVMLPPLSSG